MHCHKTGLGAQCAHPEPKSRAHCACSALVVGAAVRTVGLSRACRARSQRKSRACWVCTCRDTPRQPAPRSRPHFDVATPRQPESCRDINRCRDTTQTSPGRDTKTRSRPSWRLPYVATSISCRDIVSAHSGPSRSRHQIHVATSHTATHVATSYPCRDAFLLNQTRPGRDFISGRDLTLTRPGRDLKVMSRPHIVFPRSPHEFHVAT